MATRFLLRHFYGEFFFKAKLTSLIEFYLSSAVLFVLFIDFT